MKEAISPLVELKNQWLLSQVDVEFPTQESLQGRALYQNYLAQCQYHEVSPEDNVDNVPCDEVYLVDFHRLTILFSQLQSKRWLDQDEQALVVEFLTQIILADDHQLYVGFSSGEASAVAIVSENEQQRLISDVLVLGALSQQDVLGFAKTLNQHLIDTGAEEKSLVVEL